MQGNLVYKLRLIKLPNIQRMDDPDFFVGDVGEGWEFSDTLIIFGLFSVIVENYFRHYFRHCLILTCNLVIENQ